MDVGSGPVKQTKVDTGSFGITANMYLLTDLHTQRSSVLFPMVCNWITFAEFMPAAIRDTSKPSRAKRTCCEGLDSMLSTQPKHDVFVNIFFREKICMSLQMDDVDVDPASAKKEDATGQADVLSRDGRFRWVKAWQSWVPTGREESNLSPTYDPSPNEILSLAATPRIQHGSSCVCAQCATAGQRYNDYAKAKRLRDVNGF